jgi:hypothetical protein
MTEHPKTKNPKYSLQRNGYIVNVIAHITEGLGPHVRGKPGKHSAQRMNRGRHQT